MRWTGWILAIAVGWASVADGQSCCRRSGGCLTGYFGPLSGEACCSPPGFSVSAWPGPCCCYANPCPCCDNAWDGYCAHHARAQAFWAQVGVPKNCGSCCRCAPSRTQAMGCAVCSGSPSPAAQPMTAPVVEAPAPGAQSGPSLPPAGSSAKEAVPSTAEPGSASPAPRPVPPPPPVPDSSRKMPNPSAAPASISPSQPLKPSEDAFRGLGQLWIR